jgi:uncharacterized protein YdeI (YjbR/CyaY-like superfamily)
MTRDSRGKGDNPGGHTGTELTVPHDLQIELNDDPAAAAAFAALPYSHRREYVDWILAAKRPETRARRIEKTIEMITAGAGPRATR